MQSELDIVLSDEKVRRLDNEQLWIVYRILQLFLGLGGPRPTHDEIDAAFGRIEKIVMRSAIVRNPNK